MRANILNAFVVFLFDQIAQMQPESNSSFLRHISEKCDFPARITGKFFIFSRLYVFRSWGRVGTTIGGTKLEDFDDLTDAIENFKSIFIDKTGNR
jgi:hypothetical protein